MVTKAFCECLIDVYHGEVSGEGFFSGLLGAAEDVDQRYVAGSMLQFETEGKAIMRPLLMRLGLTILEDPEIRGGGAAAADALNAFPWGERFAALRNVVESTYLPRYLELATLVHADEDPEAARIATFMGTHERAVVSVGENVLLGRPDPVAPIAALLHFRLPRPPR
ncbi:MAG TPA: hypothetical protein VMT89_15565 [Candidatus Acidoferrales bacterium]|nr:hypothetical protein [Candidatus Acidoferrales bacterium]